MNLNIKDDLNEYDKNLEAYRVAIDNYLKRPTKLNKTRIFERFMFLKQTRERIHRKLRDDLCK